MAKAATPILPTEPVAAPARHHTVTLFRGTPIEAMNEADLRKSLLVAVKALNDIAGAQSERQVARIIEGLGL